MTTVGNVHVELELWLSEEPMLCEFAKLHVLHVLEKATAWNAALELEVSLLQVKLEREKA